MKGKSNSSRANNNYKPKKFPDSNNKTDLYKKDSQHVEKKIIEKYLQKGFESLSVEELAFTLINPTFETEFKKISGTSWPIENKSKAKERLNFSKFNIEWSVSVNNKSPAAMLKTPFGVLFTLVERGDVQKVSEFFRKNSQYMKEIISLVDNNKKSLLHVAAKVGNVNMVTFLLSKKFSVYFRDKFLRTPLHLACQFGREVCADELIKAGAQILARDSIGRTCLHYAACSDSTNLVTLILGKEPDLVTARDTYGRTPLHYSVWNGTAEQVKIVIKLLESKAEVDALDEEGMTALHFAAEAGKGKIIPILLKYGANPFIRDGRTGRTAIELACNDRIREMIIVYASKDYEPQLSLLKLYGQKIEPGQEIENGGFRIGYNRKTSKSKSKGKKNKNNTNANGGEEEMDEKIGNLLQNTYRKKLLELLRAIQLYGVKTMQHMTRPELYSGSWLEKVNNANDFFNFISRLSPQEAILSIYNVLYPYSDKLPKAQGDEPSLANFFNLNNPNNFIKTESNQKDIGDDFNIEINRNIHSNNSEIAILKEQIKKLNKKIDESKEQAENAEIEKLKLEVEKYQSENDTLKKQSDNLTTQISLLHENVRNYEKKQDKLQKNVDSQKDKLIKALNSQIGNLSIEMKILKNDNLNMTQKGTFSQKNGNGKYLNPKLIDTQSNLKSLTLEEEKNIYVFKNLCNKTNKGLYNILLDYDRDNDFYLLKQEFISVMDFIQLPFDQRDTILKVSGFDTNMKLSINRIVSSFFDREENKIILLNQFLFNIIYKLNMMKKNVEDLYKELENKSKNKYIKKEDLIKTLEDFMIRKEDIDGLINNWDYKDNEEVINIDDLINHLKQREIIINDIIDINNELKFGNEIIINNIDYNVNENEESDNKSKSEHSNINNNNNNVSEKINYGKESENENNIVSYDYNNNKKIINININAINNNKKENKKINEENNINDYKEKENDQNEIQNEIQNENEKEIEENNNNENQNENEQNYYDDFNNQVEEEEKNDNNISNEIEQSKNDEFDINDNNINEEEEDKKDEGSPSTSKKKKKKSTSKKKKKSKSKKSTEKLNIDEIINGELKVQVTNIENVMVPKTISIPSSFSLTCSIEGIDKMLKSREVTTDDLRNVSFNWATRILLKKRTLKDLSSFCNIGLSVEQNNRNIPLGNCQFAWTKCLYKKNWDKFAINEFFQVLTERKYKKIPMGNIKILAKFIPFGSTNSNYDKKGKKKKTPTNLNGIAEEPSVHSTISNKNENDNNINEDSLDQNNINIQEHKDNEQDDDEFIEENQGKQIIKGFDVEITNVSDKEELINKNLYLTVSAIEDNNEQEKINREKLSDILQNLPSTQQFNVYSYKNNNRIKVIFYLKDEEDNNIGILPIILSNKESHLEKTDKFTFKTSDDGKNYVFFLKITINTTEDI